MAGRATAQHALHALYLIARHDPCPVDALADSGSLTAVAQLALRECTNPSAAMLEPTAGLAIALLLRVARSRVRCFSAAFSAPPCIQRERRRR